MTTGARLVITGTDSSGKAIVASDQRVVGPRVSETLGSWSAELWKMSEIPPKLSSDGSPAAREDFPRRGSLLYRMIQMPAESTLRKNPEETASYYGRDISLDSPDHGMHRTDTVDLIIIISGEVWCKFEDSEVLLKSGDTLIQRGGIHAWRNRGDEPCLMAAIIIGAQRD